MDVVALNDFYIDYKRCERINLNEMHINVDNRKPIMLIYDKRQIYVNSWVQLLTEIFDLFNKESYKTFDDLIRYRKPNDDEFIFSKRMRSQDIILDNGCYGKFKVNGNKALEVIRKLCVCYDKSYDVLTIFVYKKLKDETKEYKRDIYLDAIRNYYKYLINYCGFTKEKAIEIINCIKEYDKYYKKISKAYDSSYLFKKSKLFYDYRTKIIKYVSDNKLKEKEEIEMFKECALYLYRYYQELEGIRGNKEQRNEN